MKAPASEIKQYEKALREAVRFLKQKFGEPPDLAVVFGSGLGEAFVSGRRSKKTLPYEKIPHFGKITVGGHPGHLHYFPRGRGNAWSLLVFHGRRHYYEGMHPSELVFPFRATALWGVKRILLTNAAGALRKGLKPGALVGIKDHINLMGFNPLRGPNIPSLGPRFPSLHQLYKGPLGKGLLRAARSCHVSMTQGVYVGLAGPSYETPAEVRAYQKLGGDLVGMSTVPEAIAATHAGMDVAGLSVVANSSDQMHLGLDHEEVLAQVLRGDGKLAKILLRLVQKGI